MTITPTLTLVAHTFGVSPSEILSRARPYRIAIARQALMHALHIQGHKDSRIAKAIRKDRTSVVKGRRALRNQADTDKRIADKVDHILQQLTKQPQ